VTYRLVGNRVSLLPIAAHCGLASKLASQHGAGRAAALSSAFHAKTAGASDASEKLARLTPEELDQIQDWAKPTPVTIQGVSCTYEKALKEQPVGLDENGEWIYDGDAVTCGTLDFAWAVPMNDGLGGIAVVADMKKSTWTTSGPDSLQLLTYGYAQAKRWGFSRFMVGLWIIESAEWVWSPTIYTVEGFDGLDLWGRIYHAAMNRSDEASYGEHCSSCYARLHCPEYTAPAALADTVLAPATVDGAIDDPEALGRLLAYCERTEAMIKKVKDHAKEAARRGLLVKHPETGKELAFIRCKSPEALDRVALFAAMPEAKRFMKRGDGYQRAMWQKAAK
jgi:hypothetical protein